MKREVPMNNAKLLNRKNYGYRQGMNDWGKKTGDTMVKDRTEGR